MEARRNCSHTEQRKADQPETERLDRPKDENVSKNPQKSPKRRWSIDYAKTFIQASHSEKLPSKPPLRSQFLPICTPPSGIPITSFEPEIKKAATPPIEAVDAQGYYRCPQCLFLCWICSTSGPVVRSHRSEALQSEKMPPYNVQDPTPSVAMQTTRSSSTETVERRRKRKRSGSQHINPGNLDSGHHILALSGVDVWDICQRLQPDSLPHDGSQDDPSIRSSVWLQIDHGEACALSTQFVQFYQREYDEPTFRVLVTNWLMRPERFADPNGPQDTLCFWKEEWKPRKEGPPRQLSQHTYDWDIRSDRTYMVAMNLFEKSFREVVQSSWFCADCSGVAPYLTLDFGFDSGSDAIMKISAASAMWLFQRKRMRDQMRSQDYSDLRHYSITFKYGSFQIWQAEFDGKRYSVRKIADGPLTSPDGVKDCMRWSNAIHRWGLGPNARSFKRDVEKFYGRHRGAEQGE